MKLYLPLPRINNDKTSAAIVMKIKWNIDNSVGMRENLIYQEKMNAYMGTDAVIGKATEKQGHGCTITLQGGNF